MARRLEVLLNVVMLLVCLAIGWRLIRPATPSVTLSRATQRPEPPLPTEPISLQGADLRGSGAARIVLIEYSDFQCPFCVRFASDVLPKIQKAYVESGKVLLAFRQFPLESLHPQARQAAGAAVCAGRQARFWEMHDLLFANPSQLDRAAVLGRAEVLSLRMSEFAKCLDNDAGADIEVDIKDGAAAGVFSTPTFFLGRRFGDDVKVSVPIAGTRPFQQFQEVIEKLLEREGTR